MSVVVGLVASLGWASCGGGRAVADPPDYEAVEAPRGRALQELGPLACRRWLARLEVPHRAAEHERIDQAVRLTGPVAGVAVEYVGRNREHTLMDCRLVVALAQWARALRAEGVTRIRHLSAYRGGARVRGTGSPSGHAKGLALDVRYLHFGDGESAEVFDVLEGWQPRGRGDDPCASHAGEEARSRALREGLCAAVEAGLFQVVVTPHHNDAHANHVHVEVVPDVGWTWMR
ncbi:MAG TPA: extensin family protein [Polyangiaceae bacterium LLY-WYZ-15_(1-7)]|nr:extensin family protein [Polyangiaceae bacterium LLY-WYZ-15_(1-7)]HJL10644.1 extensin family protein [Polyangiaceae bacterium LLY-WYZ-15_(1-7)]HJL22186.1 extensin family protein [Polyangiaceae bacterium LLY-WYZ-15_(1-7)]HJL36035.1 extensin family protein [Polyangiaceae bacterium LLY-WYZ-15_(1-7)]